MCAWVYFWVLFFLFHCSVCVFLCQYHTLITFWYSLKSGSMMFLFFILKMALAIWGLLWFYVNIRSVLFLWKMATLEFWYRIYLHRRFCDIWDVDEERKHAASDGAGLTVCRKHQLYKLMEGRGLFYPSWPSVPGT